MSHDANSARLVSAPLSKVGDAFNMLGSIFQKFPELRELPLETDKPPSDDETTADLQEKNETCMDCRRFAEMISLVTARHAELCRNSMGDRLNPNLDLDECGVTGMRAESALKHKAKLMPLLEVYASEPLSKRQRTGEK